MKTRLDFANVRGGMMLTAQDLLMNWAIGELTLGDDPCPLAPRTCGSAERYYDIPDWGTEERHYYVVNKEHHALVSMFMRTQPLIVRRVIIYEYIDFRYDSEKARRRKTAKKLKLSMEAVNNILDKAHSQLMSYVKRRV